jgi:hypothetical protein
LAGASLESHVVNIREDGRMINERRCKLRKLLIMVGER